MRDAQTNNVVFTWKINVRSMRHHTRHHIKQHGVKAKIITLFTRWKILRLFCQVQELGQVACHIHNIFSVSPSVSRWLSSIVRHDTHIDILLPILFPGLDPEKSPTSTVYFRWPIFPIKVTLYMYMGMYPFLPVTIAFVQNLWKIVTIDNCREEKLKLLLNCQRVHVCLRWALRWRSYWRARPASRSRRPTARSARSSASAGSPRAAGASAGPCSATSPSPGSSPCRWPAYCRPAACSSSVSSSISELLRLEGYRGGLPLCVVVGIARVAAMSFFIFF